LDLYLTSPIGKAEYARRLVVDSPQGSISRYMRDDWGGANKDEYLSYGKKRDRDIRAGRRRLSYFFRSDPDYVHFSPTV
jgi:hypothetical protein